MTNEIARFLNRLMFVQLSLIFLSSSTTAHEPKKFQNDLQFEMEEVPNNKSNS
jgi:hypothetical protein